MAGLRAVIFDLDDTLYPEASYVLSGFRAAAAWAEQRLGLPCQQGFQELCRLFQEGVRGDTFDRWLESRGYPPHEWTSLLVQVYRSHVPRIAPFQEAGALLQRLRSGFRVGLLSDGYLEVQKMKLASLGLGPLFDAVIFSDEYGRGAWKPSTRPFELALETLGVGCAEAVYVGDNPAKDFLGARRAGLWSVRVRHPGGVYSSVEPESAEYAPDAEIASLGQLEAVLGRLRVPNRTEPFHC